MFSKFCEFMNVETPEILEGDIYENFIEHLGGKSFGNGLFHSFSKEKLHTWEKILLVFHPKSGGLFRLVGFDWLGYVYGILKTTDTLVMFDVETGEISDTGLSLEEYLNEEIPENITGCLDSENYLKWVELNGKYLGDNECAGLSVSLCLGGEETLDNMKAIDIEVYWDITLQLRKQLEEVPEGTEIIGFNFTDSDEDG